MAENFLFRREFVAVIALLCFSSCSSCTENTPPKKNQVAPVGSEKEINPPQQISKDMAKPINIPLDQIWAYDMPGTRDVRSLVDGKQISQPIGMRVGGPSSFMSHKGQQIAGPGFAVLGTGKEALLATHEKLPKEQKPLDVFPSKKELSAVFFSHSFNYYVHLHRVERQGNIIIVYYRFVPHETKELSSHIALIPIGKLSAGEYVVEIVRSPMEKKFLGLGFKPVSEEWERKVICKPFSFSIVKNK